MASFSPSQGPLLIDWLDKLKATSGHVTQFRVPPGHVRQQLQTNQPSYFVFKPNNPKVGEENPSEALNKKPKPPSLKKRLDFGLLSPSSALQRSSLCVLHVCFLTDNKCLPLNADSAYGV